MKKILITFLFASFTFIALCGCSSLGKVSVTEDTIVAGTEYSVNDLFTTSEENIELSMTPEKINATSLDPVKVTLQVTPAVSY